MRNFNLPCRKATRLPKFDYSAAGYYFITICTLNRQPLLSRMFVGDGVLDVPKIMLLPHGEISNNQIEEMNKTYSDISVEKYVIMPDHIHLILHLADISCGSSGTPTPTNSRTAKFVSTFKRMCNKKYGQNIWQRSFNDHIIRGKSDYLEIWNYIDTNPQNPKIFP